MDRKDLGIFLFIFLLNLVLVFCQPLYSVILTDEGQYLLLSKKMIDGWVPYRDIIENKPLGMYISMIPAVLLCGKDIAKLRIYTSLMVSLTIFFTYLIGKKLENWKIGLLAATMMAFITAFPGLNGYTVMTDMVANLFIVPMFYCLICLELTPFVVFLIGLLFAAACSVRQTSILMIIPIVFVYYSSKKRFKHIKTIAVFAVGMAIIFIPMLLYLLANSALYDAVYWVFISQLIGVAGTWSTAYKISNLIMLGILFLPFILLTVVGLIGIRRKYYVIILWFLCSFTIAQITYTYWHNYLFVIPPFSIFAAVGVGNIIKLADKLRGGLGRSIFIGIITFFVLIFSMFLVAEISLMGGIRYSSWEEQTGISNYIRANSQPDDRIFVFGVNSEVYYLSDRDPATRMSFFGGYTCNMSKGEADEFIFGPISRQSTKYFIINHPNIVDMCGNESKVEREVMTYVNSTYIYAGFWGPLEIYKRNESNSA